MTEKELKEGTKGILGLDSNAHSVLVGYDKSDRRAQEWEEFMIENNLTIHNDSHSCTFENTRGFKSKIDWTLSTNCAAENIDGWKVREDIVTLSDHKWLEYNLLEEVKITTEKRRNYHKVDWCNYCEELEKNLKLDESQNSVASLSVDEEAGRLLEALTKTTEKVVPYRRITKYRNKWWTGKLQRLKTAYKKAKKGTNKQNKLQAKLEYETAINEAKQKSWRKFFRVG